MQVYVSGSLAYDRIMNFPGKFVDHILPEKIHILNVCFVVNGMKENYGGTAGNIAYSLSLLGERPYILSTAGKDFNRYKNWLVQNHLPLDGIRHVPEEFTASAYITTDITDNQITGFNPGAMNHPSHIQRMLMPSNSGEQALAILAPGNIDDMLIYCRRYKELKIPYIFDPGQQIPGLSREALLEMISGAELLVSNDYELEMIKKTVDMGKNALLDRCHAVITTLGENGSTVLTREIEAHIPSVPAEKLEDPTGAGDAYRAGLMKGMLMGKSLVECARMGATCASYAVAHYGTQEHRFTESEFWEKYEAHFIFHKDPLKKGA